MSDEYFNEISSVINEIDKNKLFKIAKVLLDAKNFKKNIYVVGNGGSSFSAAHFAQDLVKQCNITAYNLTDNIGLITAIANDISFDDIFSFQLNTLKPGIIIAISCSGNSKNIIKLIDTAILKGYKIIILTGKDGGLIKNKTELEIKINSNNIYLIESVHSMILHFLIDVIAKELQK